MSQNKINNESIYTWIYKYIHEHPSIITHCDYFLLCKVNFVEKKYYIKMIQFSFSYFIDIRGSATK